VLKIKVSDFGSEMSAVTQGPIIFSQFHHEEGVQGRKEKF
jgi:hypothetical protein